MLYATLVLIICLFAVDRCHQLKSFSEHSINKKETIKNYDKGKQNLQANIQNSKPRNTEIYQSEILRSKEDCDSDFIKQLSLLLDTFNISVKSEEIDLLRTYIKVKATARNWLSGLHFIVMLNVKKSYPEYSVGKTVVSQDELPARKKELFILDRFAKHEIESVKLELVVKNRRQTNESLLEIRMEIDFSPYNFEAENVYSSYIKGGTGSRFFKNKSVWKRKHLRVRRFSSASISIGSFLALFSSILCGFSFALKKWSLVQMDKNKSFYFDKSWWKGHLLMMIGDILHFIAFYFAPSIIVCTLQILTVLVAAVMSSKLLGEKLHKYGKLAFALSLGGCWVIVFHAPNEPHIGRIGTLLHMISSRIFLIYLTFLGTITILLIFYLTPKYGQINSLAYTIQSAIFGSMIVIGLKGIILGFTDTLHHWLPWTSLLAVVILLLFQLEYLNKALAVYNALVVTTQYYVLYSGFVIIASSLLFKVWKKSSQEAIFTNFCGLLTIALGALILTIFEERDAVFNFSRLFAGPEKRNKM